MLLLFAGPSGSGKSSAAALLKPKLKAEVYSGKGYLRMAKGPAEAWNKFKVVLQEAVDGKRNAILILVGTDNLVKAGSVFLAADTFLGPLYFAHGRASGGASSFYLFLGNPR